MINRYTLSHIIIVLWIILLWVIFYQNITLAQTTLQSELEIKPTANTQKKYLSVSNAIFENSEFLLQSKLDNLKVEANLYNDASIQKYVSDKNKLNNKYYEPIDLVTVDKTYIVSDKADHKLRMNANNALLELSKEFSTVFNGDKMYLYSSYRSPWHQAYLLKQWCSTTLCAAVWASEHQLWLAVDIHIYTAKKQTTKMWWKYYDWMIENAHLYWYTNTYQKWVKVDWKIKEPRHRRYVGIEMATELYNNSLTIAEYYKNQSELKIWW